MSECPKCNQEIKHILNLVVFKDEYDDWKLGCVACVKERVLVISRIAHLKDKEPERAGDD